MNTALMKWFNSLYVPIGFLCINLNIYFKTAGALSWMPLSHLAKDRSMMLNLLLQIPLFNIGHQHTDNKLKYILEWANNVQNPIFGWNYSYS